MTATEDARARAAIGESVPASIVRQVLEDLEQARRSAAVERETSNQAEDRVEQLERILGELRPAAALAIRRGGVAMRSFLETLRDLQVPKP